MNQGTLKECFVAQIRDIYDAEKQLTRALPKLAKAANSEALGAAIEEHLEETNGQVSRLESIFEMMGLPAKGHPCKGMKGLIEEGNEAGEEDGDARDIGIIAGAQRVEHYEISAYGTARTLAEQLGNKRAAQLLQQNEDEEKAADAKLNDIAMMLYAAEGEEDGAMENGNGSKTGQRKPARSNGKTASARKASR